MISYSKKFKKRPSKISAIFFSLILLIMIGFLVSSNWRLREKRLGFNSQLEILNKKIQNLEKINQGLKEKISALAEENYLEKVARETFNLKKSGEKVVVIKRGEPLPTEIKEEKKFNFQNWFDTVGNIVRSLRRLGENINSESH